MIMMEGELCSCATHIDVGQLVCYGLDAPWLNWAYEFNLSSWIVGQPKTTIKFKDHGLLLILASNSTTSL